jgi:hypothetical protein
MGQQSNRKSEVISGKLGWRCLFNKYVFRTDSVDVLFESHVSRQFETVYITDEIEHDVGRQVPK